MFALVRTCCLSGARWQAGHKALSQMAEVRKIRLIIIIYYILANMANIPWPLEMHLDAGGLKENLSRVIIF